MVFLALVPEIIDALAAFIGATWWQLPVLVGLWKVQDVLTSSPPSLGGPAQQSPVQQAAGGLGAAVGGAGQAVGGLSQWIAGDGKWFIGAGLAAMFVLRR